VNSPGPRFPSKSFVSGSQKSTSGRAKAARNIPNTFGSRNGYLDVLCVVGKRQGIRAVVVHVVPTKMVCVRDGDVVTIILLCCYRNIIIKGACRWSGVRESSVSKPLDTTVHLGHGGVEGKLTFIWRAHTILS